MTEKKIDKSNVSNPLRDALSQLEDSSPEEEVALQDENTSEHSEVVEEVALQDENTSEHSEVVVDVPMQNKKDSFFIVVKRLFKLKTETITNDRKSKSTIDLDHEIDKANDNFSDKEKAEKKKGLPLLIKLIIIIIIISFGYLATKFDDFPKSENKEVAVITSEPALESENIPLPSIDEEIFPPEQHEISEVITDYEKESLLLNEAENISNIDETEKLIILEADVPNITNEASNSETELFNIPVVTENIDSTNPKPVETEISTSNVTNTPSLEAVSDSNNILMKELDAIKKEVAFLKESFAKHTTKRKVSITTPKVSVLEIASASPNCQECISHALITYNEKEVFVGDGENFKGYHINVKGDRVVFINSKNKNSKSFWIKNDD